jgi:hypothetical protein
MRDIRGSGFQPTKTLHFQQQPSGLRATIPTAKEILMLIGAVLNISNTYTVGVP